MTDQELIYTMALTRLMPFNASQQRTLLNEVGSATAVFENRRDLGRMMEHFSPRAAEVLAGMESELGRCEQELAYAREHKIKVLALADETAYPSRLRQCDDAPLVLYQLGAADLNARHIISVVGTRRCTERGRDLCNNLAADLARLLPDTLVVSGLAYGIDIAAHRAALANHLPTVGVLAHGLDEIYPRLHRQTAIEMLQQGGLLTEFMSHTQIEKVNFVQRNRIVAGLADATVVIETPERGGSLITAEMANGYNREVCTFPGRPTDAASAGCNHLIRRQGAHLVTSAADILADLGWQAVSQPDGQGVMDFSSAADATGATAPAQPSGNSASAASPLVAAPEEQSIVAALQANGGDLSLSDLIAKTGLPVARLTSFLLPLEMKGIIRKLAGNKYHLIH